MNSDVPSLLRHLEVSFDQPERPLPAFDVFKSDEEDEPVERESGLIARFFRSEAELERRRKRNVERARHREAREKYQQDLAKFERLQLEAETEKKMVVQFNATIKQAISLLEGDSLSNKQLLVEREKWEEKAKLAYSLFFAWRTQFVADCVATYGPRTEDEIDRLCLEAYPHSPISGDDRLGYLHKYANTHKAVKQIKHLLPTEVPCP